MTRNTQLEGLRGLCALSVLVSHLAHDTTGARTCGQEFFPGYALSLLSSFGNIGVLLFFVLSGYVIGMTALPGSINRREVGRYLRKRFVRIYPIYFVEVLASFAIAIEPFDLAQFVGHLFFVHTWIVENISSNGVLWTIHLEVAFYLLFLMVWWRPALLKPTLVLAVVSALASPFSAMHLLRILGFFSLWLLGLKLAWQPTHQNYEKPLSWKHFYASIFVAIGFTHVNAVEIIVRRYGTELHGLISTVSCIIIAGLLCQIVAALAGKRLSRYVYYTSLGASLLASMVAIAYSVLISGTFASSRTFHIAFIFIVLGSLTLISPRMPNPIPALGKLSVLGSISYGLYLVQNPVQIATYRFLSGNQNNFAWLAGVVFIIAAVFALSVLLENGLQACIVRRLRNT